MSHAPASATTPDAATTARALPLGGLATVLFLGVTAGVQMSDRGLASLLSPAIRQTFGVGDAVMGALHGIAGILVASALAVPLARLGDRYPRKWILLGLIAAWSLLTSLGALAPNFPLFFAGRAASGITEFAMIPIVYSLIPDLVGERWRVASNLVFAALMAIGASLGFYFGGDLLRVAGELQAANPAGFLANLQPWRIAQLLLACSGAPLLVLGLATVDPPRHALAAADAAIESLAGFVRARLRQVLLFVGAAGGIAIAVQAVTPMIAMALVRRYQADLGEVGHVLGLITLCTSLASLVLAGSIDRVLRARLGERARPAVMGVATALSIPCIALLPWAPSADTALVLVGAFLLATCVANALIPTMLQDLAPVNLRSRSFAAYSFLIAAFCALGPSLSGAISQFLVRDNLLLAIACAGVPVLCGTVACAAASVLGPTRVATPATA